jgi:hypothetical protein
MTKIGLSKERKVQGRKALRGLEMVVYQGEGTSSFGISRFC